MELHFGAVWAGIGEFGAAGTSPPTQLWAGSKQKFRDPEFGDEKEEEPKQEGSSPVP